MSRSENSWPSDFGDVARPSDGNIWLAPAAMSRAEDPVAVTRGLMRASPKRTSVNPI